MDSFKEALSRVILIFILIVNTCCTKFYDSNKLFFPTFKTEINQLSHYTFWFIVRNIYAEGEKVMSCY